MRVEERKSSSSSSALGDANNLLEGSGRVCLKMARG